MQRESYNNPNGGVNEFGPAIQFDTKGVEFGPWIRRFIAQVKRNWIVPNSALAIRAADTGSRRPSRRCSHWLPRRSATRSRRARSVASAGGPGNKPRVSARK